MAKEKNITFTAVIEMIGGPKEHVEDMLHKIIEDLRNMGNYEIVKEHYEEPTEQEGIFSSFVEIEAKVAEVADVAWFCFDFLPASIEIVEPENVAFKAHELSSFLNELSTRMHIVDKEMKKLQGENFLLNKNGKQIVKNSILVCLAKQDMSITDIVKFTGVPEVLIKELCEDLIKEMRIEKTDEVYKLK